MYGSFVPVGTYILAGCATIWGLTHELPPGLGEPIVFVFVFDY